ncbi:hypothetical protein [Nocardia transvalensis]|uniref:hypothetical protein n=1 Tax=Nocardia transvalensis TaxID=37333 RepID=UPI0018962805|nr:hypothetical protein [Nocardia transvalensis]MBF6332440.1 hypothetical protein [Nocardia transvalensis]
MTHMQMVEPPKAVIADPPKAIGFVRSDVSGLRAARHAIDVQRHAHSLGYRYVYTARPPVDVDEPIGYALGMAAGLDADVIVVYDLGQVDNQPALICDEGFDLEVVCPNSTWTHCTPPTPKVEARGV